MNAERSRFDRLQELFRTARKMDGAARDSLLEQVGQDDPLLRAELDALLSCADEPLDFSYAAGRSDSTVENAECPTQPWTTQAHIRPPEHIGPYHLLAEIGSGGMGVVYVAEQREPVKRRVAVKIIRHGLDTAQVLARFEAEHHALTLMNHPNIARVFDAGETEDGRPYFVMEYVPGTSISDYCDRHKLTTPQRLELFIAVCRAVQHAHQKGVIHRDLKPTNILVMMQDGSPVPKIIDFGVAKATAQRLTEKTLYTEVGQLIGTPEYMSPEQAEMTTIDIDTRTDVYSLGVILYELLVGALPFDSRDLRRAGYAEIQRIIREVDPPKPSTRLSTLGADESEVACSKRGTDTRSLARRLRGDLDWIILKALEKDRTRRYDTASDFAMDIVRHLNNEPVWASPPSALYRTMKFVRRRKGVVAANCAVLLALIIGLVFSDIYRRKAERAERRAVVEATLLKGQEHERNGRSGEAEALYDEALRLDPDNFKARALKAFLYRGRYCFEDDYTDLSHVRLAVKASEHALTHRPNWSVYNVLGTMQFILGDYAASEVALREAIAMAPTKFKVYSNLAKNLALQHRFTDALGTAHEGLTLALASDREGWKDGIWITTAMLELFNGNLDEAMHLASKAVELDEENYKSALVLSRIHFTRRDLRRALEDAERAYVLSSRNRDPKTARLLATVHLHLGHTEEALRLATEALQLGGVSAYAHLIAATAHAHLKHLSDAQYHLGLAAANPPPFEDGVYVHAEKEVLWIDTEPELASLRGLATAALAPSALAPAYHLEQQEDQGGSE